MTRSILRCGQARNCQPAEEKWSPSEPLVRPRPRNNRGLDLLRHLYSLLDSERRGTKLLTRQSDIAASVLIVLFHALGLGSGERGGRTRPQKGESQHNTPTTLVLHVCASQNRFQPITRDLGSSRKMPGFALSRRQRGSNPVGDARSSRLARPRSRLASQPFYVVVFNDPPPD